MKVGDKVLYTRIVDPTGRADGLQGYAQDFQLAADRDELERIVGADAVGFYVEAPHAQCARWYFDGVIFHETKPDE